MAAEPLRGNPPQCEIHQRVTAAAQQLNLSPRQAQVLHWIAEGKTNAEIALLMECSAFTVKSHLNAILQHLSVRSRVAAAACAYAAFIAGADALHARRRLSR
jgi:DNA-binding CsgD family transcriptional regulator